MNSRSPLVLAALFAPVLLSPIAAAKSSDLVPPEKRRAVVELAQHLTRPPEPAPVPPDLAQPFNPPGFDQPDPEELRAAAAAAAKAGGSAPSGGGGPAASPERIQQPGDREVLESLAAKLPSTSTIIFRGEPLLLMGRGRAKIGDHFTVTFNGQDYELELVSIDRTTFTLRYHSEEITRPISSKPGKSQ